MFQRSLPGVKFKDKEVDILDELGLLETLMIRYPEFIELYKELERIGRVKL